MDTYHLTFTAGQWVLAREGDPGVVAAYTTRVEGELHAGEFLRGRGGVLKTHKPDGSIDDERTIRRGDGSPEASTVTLPGGTDDISRKPDEQSMPGLRPYTFEL